MYTIYKRAPIESIVFLLEWDNGKGFISKKLYSSICRINEALKILDEKNIYYKISEIIVDEEYFDWDNKSVDTLKFIEPKGK